MLLLYLFYLSESIRFIIPRVHWACLWPTSYSSSHFLIWFVKKPKLLQRTVAEMPCLWLKMVTPPRDLEMIWKPFQWATESPHWSCPPGTDRKEGAGPRSQASAWQARASWCACQIAQAAASLSVHPQTPVGWSLGSDILKAQGALFRRP